MTKSFTEHVPDANPDYQPAYDTQEKPWPWNISDNNLKQHLKTDEILEEEEGSRDAKETKEESEATTEEPKKESKKREIISNCGSIDIGLEYNSTNKRITVTVLECNDLPNQDRGVPPIIQV